ncbi:HlyD family type I secretion periplasmic adaptor subunit [uncultured Hyphomicrobium sp.]|uniref:HlyD family type I secretion periplasmic adaptor subunit n=1 Tax=uncultured Hyphomicrobium sp. TaxID=194373 RepID=UPI0025D6EE99|nr:HlyD family type I secretion periplasmic adaptor subunit [uncultured Hyphomicrobium sp.]
MAPGSGITASDPTVFSIRKHVVFASLVMSMLGFGVGGWAATASLSGAVIAPGTFVVERNVKKVQHSYGGIVSEISVKNGDHVKIGTTLIRLDATQIRAELGVITSQLTELEARRVRLNAERDNLESMPEVRSTMNDKPEFKTSLAGEIRLFEDSKRSRESQKQQLGLRIDQLKEEIGGLSAQRDAKGGELKLIQQELEQVSLLHGKGLTPISRVYAMEREEKRLSGEHGGLVAQIARANGQISEIQVQILMIDENARVQAQRELRSIEAKLSELVEREVAANDKLSRVEIKAPQSGIVHELSAHTIGGVVTAAEQIMLIVPEEDDLTIQAQIAPTDVDQVLVGRAAKLRLSAFNQQTTPELSGHVVHVSADVTVDPKTGHNYYVARLAMDEKSRKSVGDLKLVPGMPVEVFMATGERTALSYLSKPFTDQIQRAFRE